MKRTIAAILFTALLAMGAQAQRIHAYLTAGATISQMEGDELKGFDKWGGTGGVGAMMKLTENGRWKMGIEANFAQHGMYNKSYAPGNLYNAKMTMNYVEIPLSFYFHDNRGGLTVGAGIQYGVLVQQPHGQFDFKPNYFVPDTTDMKFLRNDLAATLEFRFQVWRGLQLNLRWMHSFLPCKRNWTFTEYHKSGPETWSNNCYNHALTVRLIWEFGEQEESVFTKRRKNK